ncbi:MAG: hypothetical protein JJT96_16260 [Opitutales bacterium]|nr:hypothetical protein [Opitutales bacterium]
MTAAFDTPRFSFLGAHADDPFCITFMIAGELAAGQSPGVDRARGYRFVLPFRVLESSSDVAWEFGQADRYLQSHGTLIGANLTGNRSLGSRPSRSLCHVWNPQPEEADAKNWAHPDFVDKGESGNHRCTIL